MKSDFQARNLSIWKDKTKGLTFSEVAKKYSISISRVAQVYHKMEYKLMKLDNSITTKELKPNMIKKLSYWIIRKLSRYIGAEIIIRGTRNVGRPKGSKDGIKRLTFGYVARYNKPQKDKNWKLNRVIKSKQGYQTWWSKLSPAEKEKRMAHIRDVRIKKQLFKSRCSEKAKRFWKNISPEEKQKRLQKMYEGRNIFFQLRKMKGANR